MLIIAQFLKMTETHELFPSGDWEGFYLYPYSSKSDRHMMYFTLNFQDQQVTGSGSDDVGSFTWSGSYDKENMECVLIKHYATHIVNYQGKVDENGIWGKWNISYFSGGFHLWPKKREEEAAEEAVRTEVLSFAL